MQFILSSPLVLASSSPRRKELLNSLGLSFSAARPDASEPGAFADELPAAYCRRMAELKGLSLEEKFPDKVILSADTIVVLAGHILGKPANAAEALKMLQSLCGQTHEVITAVHIIAPGPEQLRGGGRSRRTLAVHSQVFLESPGDAFLRAYAACGEPLDKAGAYALQGKGGFLVKSVQGSPSNVIGLPLAEVVESLISMNLLSIA